MDPYVWQIPALILVGVVAGFLNVLAGGGSLLTLPLLIFFGLPAATCVAGHGSAWHHTSRSRLRCLPVSPRRAS